MRQLLDLTFPLPPNTNHMYRRKTLRNRRTGEGRVVTAMSEEARLYEYSVSLQVKESYPEFEIPLKTPLAIEMTFFYNPSHINKLDWDGSLKALQDAIFRTSNPPANDAWIRQAKVAKVLGHQEGVRVMLWAVEA